MSRDTEAQLIALARRCAHPVDALGMGVKTTYYYGGPTKNDLYAVVTFVELGKTPGTTEFYVHSIPITVPATSKLQPF